MGQRLGIIHPRLPFEYAAHKSFSFLRTFAVAPFSFLSFLTPGGALRQLADHLPGVIDI